MDYPVNIVKMALNHQPLNRIPKGEIWLGSEILRRLNLEDDINGHFKAVKILRHDIVCFPVYDKNLIKAYPNYRYFNLEEIIEATKINDGLFLTLVIDGPFQRLSQRLGLMKVLNYLGRKRTEIKIEFEEEFSNINFLINKCLDLQVNAIVIADDVAGENNLFIIPELFNNIFANFYKSLISKVHNKGMFILFHSCGDIRQFISNLIAYGFDGLASIQDRLNDLISIKKRFGKKLALMGGIDSEILEASEIPPDKLREFKRRLKMMSSGGGFILSSSTGLYRGDFIEKIEKIYRIADSLVDNYYNYT